LSILSGETSSAAANGFPLLGNVANGEYKDSILNTNNPDGFIARFGVTGVLKWSTYFGGTGADGTYNVTADASKTLYITGSTASSNFDMESYGNAYQQTPNLAAGEVYFAAFTPSNHLLWSTGFGGLQFEGSAELATYGNWSS
jgi:hypothetical protein